MYLKWNQITTKDFSDRNINDLYNQGFLFGRIDKGVMDQTRSLRVDLSNFELSSENRRVLRKTEEVKLKIAALPYSEYHWSIGKLAKDFYDTKFGERTFTANKLKELLTNEEKSNFNNLIIYSDKGGVVGYCVAKITDQILHYCYPFYDLESDIPNLGLGMMLKAIAWAKENGKKYIYLGSAQRPADTYKLQFVGIEWFDGKSWKKDEEDLKIAIQL